VRRREIAVSENVELVRRLIHAFNRLDLDAAVAVLDPGVELREWPAAPGARTYHGHEGVRRALDSWFEVWEWMQVEIKDIVDLDDRILFTLHQRAKGKGSAVEVEMDSYNVYAFRDAKVCRMELFTERDPAIAAAGLTPDLEEEKEEAR
jgi:ketosteroid isomerase-like protein